MMFALFEPAVIAALLVAATPSAIHPEPSPAAPRTSCGPAATAPRAGDCCRRFAFWGQQRTATTHHPAPAPRGAPGPKEER